jgi:hypothetical protein
MFSQILALAQNAHDSPVARRALEDCLMSLPGHTIQLPIPNQSHTNVQCLADILRLVKAEQHILASAASGASNAMGVTASLGEVRPRPTLLYFDR